MLVGFKIKFKHIRMKIKQIQEQINRLSSCKALKMNLKGNQWKLEHDQTETVSSRNCELARLPTFEAYFRILPDFVAPTLQGLNNIKEVSSN